MHPTRRTRIHPKGLQSPLEGQAHGETGANKGSICRYNMLDSLLKASPLRARERGPFTRVPRETVRKGALRRWLGKVPSMRRAYQTDLSDAEWSCIEPHLPVPKAPGRPRVHTLREILDAIFYILRSGCAWRLLPHDFPPWKTIHHYFRTWRLDGTWEKMHAALRKRVRVRMDRD